MKVRPLNLLFLLGILLLILAGLGAALALASIGTVLALAAFGLVFVFLGGYRAYW